MLITVKPFEAASATCRTFVSFPSDQLNYFCREAHVDISFFKYQGTGNDFVIVDNRELLFPAENLSVVRQLCDRKFGIGSDGLILIESSDSEDFRMNFFNPDGSQSYCGNGSRCAVHFAHELGMVGETCDFEAIDGAHRGRIEGGQVRTSIRPVTKVEEVGDDFFVNTGSPHYVHFTTDLDDLDLLKAAHAIRYSPPYDKQGVNVNFVHVIDERNIGMRTYERGVEDETLSCGTGVTAAAIAHFYRNGRGGKVHVTTRGGELEVSAQPGGDQAYFDIWLSGPATPVFRGTFPCESC